MAADVGVGWRRFHGWFPAGGGGGGRSGRPTAAYAHPEWETDSVWVWGYKTQAQAGLPHITQAADTTQSSGPAGEQVLRLGQDELGQDEQAGQWVAIFEFKRWQFIPDPAPPTPPLPGPPTPPPHAHGRASLMRMDPELDPEERLSTGSPDVISSEGGTRPAHCVSKSKCKTKAKAKAKGQSKRGGAIGPAKTARAKAGAGATRAARTH
jgi:hypothetical protein